MMNLQRLRVVALVLAVLALLAATTGFFATWHGAHGNIPSFGGFGGFGGMPGGELDVRYSLNEATVTSPYGDDQGDYSEMSREIQLTFLYQTIIVWTSVALALVGIALVAAPFWTDAPWTKPAALAGLCLLAILSLVGAGLFVNNFLNTDEGDYGSFQGEEDGIRWGPGLAWYAELGAGILALASATTLWISTRAGSVASASLALP